MTANPATSRSVGSGLRVLCAMLTAALFAVLVTAPSAFAIPTNDDVRTPFNGELNGGPISINGGTFGATYQAPDTWLTADGEPLTPGGPGACSGREMVATTWYRILGNGGEVTINTTGSDFDTVIAVYPAPTPSLPTALACNDDAGSSLQSAMKIPSVAGNAYLIQVGGCSGTNCGAAQGNLVLNVTATAPPPGGGGGGGGGTVVIPVLPPDADGDGVPENGQDRCPGLKPTADENKDGCQDKPKRIMSNLGFDAAPLGRGGSLRAVRLSRAKITLAPKGARITVSCSLCRKPGGFRRFSFTATKAGTQPVGRLSGVQLRRGGTLTVIVTAPGYLGRKIVVELGRRLSDNRFSCLAVGSTTKRVPCSTGA